MRADAAYVIANREGVCVYATDAALDLLGLDSATIRYLKVGDLFPAGAPAGLPRRLDVAAVPDAWTTVDTDVVRADGTTVCVSASSMRTANGELVLRLESGSAAARGAPSVREVLQAWRQDEYELARTSPGTPEHLLADVDARWLSGEYRRLVSAYADDLRDQ